MRPKCAKINSLSKSKYYSLNSTKKKKRISLFKKTRGKPRIGISRISAFPRKEITAPTVINGNVKARVGVQKFCTQKSRFADRRKFPKRNSPP